MEILDFAAEAKPSIASRSMEVVDWLICKLEGHSFLGSRPQKECVLELREGVDLAF
jgi:hypothetical protein